MKSLSAMRLKESGGEVVNAKHIFYLSILTLSLGNG